MRLGDRISVHGQRTRPLPLPFVMIVMKPGKKKRLNGQDTEVKNCLAGGDFLDVQRRKTNDFLCGLYCQINQFTPIIQSPKVSKSKALTSAFSPFLSTHSDEPEPNSDDSDKPTI